MKSLRTSIIGCVLILQCVASWAVIGVRISDLSNSPTPPNPIKVWGSVTSVSPVKITDGTTEIQVSGLSASLHDFVIVTGDWNGSVLTVNGSVEYYIGPAGVQMISIPAGSFDMGTPTSYTASHNLDEHPQHQVYLSAYSIGKYEVTRGEYRAFMAATGRAAPSYWAETQTWNGQTFTQTENHPVVGVTYYDAEAYCTWAGGHLPTEAQWERAARWTDSSSRVYPWGDVWNNEYCNNWYDTNPAAGGGPYRYQTAPVGSYSSYGSPSGCQDMAGNVWEYCKDWYQGDYYSLSPTSDPQGPGTGSDRVRRGGSWTYYYDDNNTTRCASRNSFDPSWSSISVGFRLAR